MKKKSAIILLLLLAVCLVACGNADNSADEKELIYIDSEDNSGYDTSPIELVCVADEAIVLRVSKDYVNQYALSSNYCTEYLDEKGMNIASIVFSESEEYIICRMNFSGDSNSLTSEYEGVIEKNDDYIFILKGEHDEVKSGIKTTKNFKSTMVPTDGMPTMYSIRVEYMQDFPEFLMDNDEAPSEGSKPTGEDETSATIPIESQNGDVKATSYYKTVTCYADAIYYIFEDMHHFGNNNVPAGSIWGEQVRLIMNYDSSTGELLSANVEMFVELSSGDEDDELISAIKKTGYDKYFLNYNKVVLEKYDDGSSHIVKISSPLGNLTEMIQEGPGVSLEQDVDSYLVWEQNIEELIESVKSFEANGLNVEEGSNYIVNPLNGIRYEWR